MSDMAVLSRSPSSIGSAGVEEILEALPEAVVVIDPVQDCIVQVNRQAVRLVEMEESALTALAPSYLFREEMGMLVVLTQAALHKGHFRVSELGLRTPGGEYRVLEVSASRLERPGDGPLLVCVWRDHVQEERRRRAVEARAIHRSGLERWKSIESIFSEFERQNQLILNAAGEGIYGVDREGRATFVNPAAERMLGWKAEDLVGRNIHELIHHSRKDGSTYPAEKCHIFAAFHDGKSRHVDTEVFWRSDGCCIPVDYTSTPMLEEGRIVGAVVIFRDISERQEAEEKLRAALEEVGRLKTRLELENAYLQEEFLSEHNYKEIVGRSPAILRIIRQIDVVAPTGATVLITGESGTGKELIARAIHQGSDRRDRPMIRVNCAAIPRELFESEFFGHVKGAFTGALSSRPGRFELADGGTLFLDEVGEIPLDLQGKLLRVIEEQQFERIGESVTRKVDVRIVAATNRDLRREVREGRFREDLYFRLNVFPIESVPLRERTEDIPLLVSHFLRSASLKFSKPGIRVSRGDIERLQAYHWPGNVRELVNVIERAVILAQDGRLRLELGDGRTEGLPATSGTRACRVLTRSELRALEINSIVVALRRCGGKVFGPGGAAELLEMRPTTLASRLKALGIDRRRVMEDGG